MSKTLNKKYTQLEDENTGDALMVAPDFFFWITEGDRSIYFQKGEFYEGEDLPPISWKDVPEFFWRVIRESYSSEIINREGLVLPEHRKPTEDEVYKQKEEKANTLWQCDECDDQVPFSGKGLHKGRHRKVENDKKRRAEREKREQLEPV